MAQQTYNIPDHVKGDTFEGVQFNVTVNGSALNLTGATIKMQLKPNANPGTTATLTLDTTDGITITDAVNGQFEIDQQVIDIAADCYYYDIQITLSGGSVKTYIKGNWNITQDITE